MFLCYTKYVTPACSEQKPFWKTEATFNQTLTIKVVYNKVMSKNTKKRFPWHLEVTYISFLGGSFVDTFVSKAGKFGN